MEVSKNTICIYPFIIEEKRYNKYLYKLLKDEHSEIKVFDSFEEKELQEYFLPSMRKILFNNFNITKDKVKDLSKIDFEVQATIISKYDSIILNYKINEKESMQIISFNSGIGFLIFDMDKTEKAKRFINNMLKENVDSEELNLDKQKYIRYTCENNASQSKYFYTYIIELYKKIYLKNIIYKYKTKKNKYVRKEFVEFTKNIWVQEITIDETGNDLIRKWKKQLELERLFNNVKSKYNILYKEENIEKNEKINKIIIVILIISLILNIINFILLLK